MQIAGILIIVFGLQMSGLLQFKLLMKEKRIDSDTILHSLKKDSSLGKSPFLLQSFLGSIQDILET